VVVVAVIVAAGDMALMVVMLVDRMVLMLLVPLVPLVLSAVAVVVVVSNALVRVRKTRKTKSKRVLNSTRPSFETSTSQMARVCSLVKLWSKNGSS
jgi:hypothetical protein